MGRTHRRVLTTFASVSSRLRIAGLVALVLALLATGAVLWFGDMGTEFGWFAYAPLEQSAPGILLITGRRQVALLASLIGLVLLSGLVGFVIGRRAKPDLSA